MEFLRDYFGEEALKFDEFIEKLEANDVTLVEDDGTIKVPKYRFDEVLEEKKELEKDLRELKAEHMTEEELRKQELEDARRAKQEAELELTKLKVTEKFVKAGLEEDEYSSVLDSILDEDRNKAMEKADNLINLLDAQKAKVEKALKKQELKEMGDFKSDNNQEGVVTVEQFKDMGLSERASLYKQNPELHDKLAEEVTSQ
ncbi:MAG: hypothetical protein ACOCQD_01555 [archaeon]